MSLTISTDQHTITAKVDPIATMEQLKISIRSALQEAEKLDPQYKSKFQISEVQKKGMRTGRYYIWFNNPQIYHMLLGKNPDGSMRVIQYEDPNWQPPQEELEFKPGMSWADMMEEEDAHTCPIIEEQLPPLITLPTIPLTPEQQKEHPEHLTEVIIKLEPAYAHNVDDTYSQNVLRSSALLPFMTEEFIKKEFEHFSHSNRQITYKVTNNQGKKVTVTENYPQVKVVTHNTPKRPEKIAYVTFDPMTRDASFAFHLMRRREYKNFKTGETFVVNYYYAKTRPNK